MGLATLSCLYGANLVTRGQHGGRVTPLSFGLSMAGLALVVRRAWQRVGR